MIIVDYNVGNIGSIVNMFKKIGVRATLSSDENVIANADKIFFPGVGSFGHGMACLKKSGLIDVLEQKILKDNVPVLGVCLGMQLMFEHSEEGDCEGLGWIKGCVKHFDLHKIDKNLKVPHMGWNQIKVKQSLDLINNLPDEPRFYFAHSYHAVCDDESNVLATANHGYDFPCVVQNGNVYGAQFHPEKSHKFGMSLLKNFTEMEN
jgi:glutamine amidotransferase